MSITRREWLALGAGWAAAMGSGAARAAAHVKVSLWDRGAMSMNMQGHGRMMGMGGPGAGGQNMPMAPMGVKLASDTVPAGEVTFEVRNDSKALVHEMVISPVRDIQSPLPYDQAKNQVDEDAAGHLGEVAELEPGKSGSLTLTLKPGRYVLYCNVPGHYARGMWSLLTVK